MSKLATVLTASVFGLAITQAGAQSIGFDGAVIGAGCDYYNESGFTVGTAGGGEAYGATHIPARITVAFGGPESRQMFTYTPFY